MLIHSFERREGMQEAERLLGPITDQMTQREFPHRLHILFGERNAFDAQILNRHAAQRAQ